MKTKEIREKTTEALIHELTDRQKHLFELRSQAVTEKLEDPSQLLKTRREIARHGGMRRRPGLDAGRVGEKDGGSGGGRGRPCERGRPDGRHTDRDDADAQSLSYHRNVLSCLL